MGKPFPQSNQFTGTALPANHQPTAKLPHINNPLPANPLPTNTQRSGNPLPTNTLVTGILPHTNTQPTGISPHTNDQLTGDLPHTDSQLTGDSPHANTQPTGDSPHTNTLVTGVLPHTNSQPTGDSPHTNGQPTGNSPHADTQPTGNSPHTDSQLSGSPLRTNRQPPAKSLYLGGPILTMDHDPQTSAVLVENGKITAIGEAAKAVKDAEVIHLNGQTLMPAFIDPHSHLTALASTLDLVPLSNAASFQDVQTALIERLQANPPQPGGWLIGSGYDHNCLTEKRHPDKTVLDQVSQEVPILIAHASGHMGVVNSAALKAMGLTSASPDPEGGRYGRTQAGEPDGYLEEKAFINMSTHMAAPSLEEMAQKVLAAEKVYFAHGITVIQDGLTTARDFDVLKRAEPHLTAHVIAYIDFNSTPETLTSHPQYLSSRPLSIGGYKILLDGSPQGKTAWLTQPYENSGDYCGYPVYTDAQVTHFIETALREGRQLLTHCNGDAAADQLIRCFKQALSATGVKDTYRPVMIHAQTVRPDQLDDMRKLGMIASFFNVHTYYWGDVHLENLGDKRTKRISPAATALKKGVSFNLHQDTPVVPPDMLLTVWAAVNRLSRTGQDMGRAERISPQEALKAVTTYAAYQYGLENQKGLIRPGFDADFVRLSANPLKVDPITLRDITVEQTIKAGKTVYQKERP